MIKSILGFCQCKGCLRRANYTVASRDKDTQEVIVEINLCHKHFNEFEERASSKGLALKEEARW